MPSELSEQIMLVKALKRAKLTFCAVPNGGTRRKSEAVNLKASGVQAGVPDLLIFDSPPNQEGVGVALEMKREGGSPSSVSSKQRLWLDQLERRGWVPLVGYGWRDAVEKLRNLGYKL